MATDELRSLIRKLNPVCQTALDQAAKLAVSRTNYDVEIEHWLLKLLESRKTDLAAVMESYGIDLSRLSRDLTHALDAMKTGNGRGIPAFAPNTVTMARKGWLIASLDGSTQTRSGHLLQALVSDDLLLRQAKESSDEFSKLPAPAVLAKDLLAVAADSGEQSAPAPQAATDAGWPSKKPGAGSSKTPALDQFTIDLTERARQGQIDPVLGRDAEVRQIVDILTRRRQNNPILTGEAGVGKTAVVEGFAQRVVSGDVPPPLRGVKVCTLDMGLLQAGAGIKGEFENRLKTVLEEVKSSPVPIILFIDEAHTMIGAGGQAGQGDAANLLKPAFARGELRTIAATTWSEYKEYFEKDAALARRFQVVKVGEPSEEVAIQMMRGLVATLEKHHKVEVLDEAVVESVRLSQRYISGRQLPDKSVSLLDTACARVAIGLTSSPPALEDAQRRWEQLGVSIDILTRESNIGGDHDERLAELATMKAVAEAEVKALQERWSKERDLALQIREIRDKLSGPTPGRAKESPKPTDGASPAKPAAAEPAPELTEQQRTEFRAKLPELAARLKELQGDKPLLQFCVDGQAISEVVSTWTGIPVGRMVANEIQTVLKLEEKLGDRIIGQNHALRAIAQSMRTSRARMTDPRKPIGVFLMVGTSGVGKTETAIAVADLLYGGDQNMTVINMSEFKEEHKISLLMGSPPGYVGYGKGGVLTEAVRRKPYSVVLFDEMEKAHPGLQDVFYQVFDKGIMRDSEGRDVDFKNTVIIMTSNAATDLITKLCADPDTRPTPEGLTEAIYPELLKTFKPAFLGRVTIVPYLPLTDDVMRKIVELQLGRIVRRVRESYKATFSYSPDVVSSIVARCTEVSTGGRNVDHILNRTMLPELSAEFLGRLGAGEAVKSVQVSVDDKGGFVYAIS